MGCLRGHVHHADEQRIAPLALLERGQLEGPGDAQEGMRAGQVAASGRVEVVTDVRFMPKGRGFLGEGCPGVGRAARQEGVLLGDGTQTVTSGRCPEGPKRVVDVSVCLEKTLGEDQASSLQACVVGVHSSGEEGGPQATVLGGDEVTAGFL